MTTRSRAAISGVLITGLLVGCATSGYRKIGALLDPVDKSVNEWGKVTVSDLVLFPNKGQFDIGYSTNTAYYIQKAREEVEGAARTSIEKVMRTAVALQGGFQPPISVGEAPGANKAPEPSLSTPEGSASEALSGKTISPSLPQYDGNMKLRERLALSAGVNDKLSELALSALANPKDLPSNKRVYFGVLQVTCQPGTRTRQGYVGDVNISLEYGYTETPGTNQPSDGKPPQEKGNSLMSYSPGLDSMVLTGPASGAGRKFLSGTNQPSSFAVLPMMDSQRLDLRSSFRDQQELVLTLAAALAAQGMTAEAKFMIDYVRRRESDLASRSAVPTATTYADGMTFGLQIYPSFQAIEDPAEKFSKGANVLQPVSFPAVVVMLIDEQDLKMEGNTGTNLATHLAVHVRTRWVPIDGGPTLPPSKRIALADKLEMAQAELERISKADTNFMESLTHFEARREIRALASVGAGITRISPLPSELTQKPKASSPPHAPTLSDVTGTLKGWKNAPSVFVFSGSNFVGNGQSIVKAVTLNGVECQHFVHNESTIVTVVPPNHFSNTNAAQMVLAVVTSSGAARATVNVAFDQVAPVDQRDKPAFDLKRDPHGKLVGIEVKDPGDLSAEQILEAIKEILLTIDKPPKTIRKGKE